ncbi:MAG: PKD domain-containing protein [Nitrospinae bacterium]|nr:PKD domain-containing protein [Nitrospinota bacterium]
MEPVKNKLLAAVMAMTLSLAGCGLENKINETLNPPVADTSPKAVFAVDGGVSKVGAQITLDGSYSYDPQAKSITYAWTLEPPRGSVAALGSATSTITSFTADKGGYYLVSLQVTNSGGAVSEVESYTVSIEGTDSNHPPVAQAGADLTVTAPDVAILDGSLSYDADGDNLRYTWTLISQPSTSTAATVSDTSSHTAFLYPDVAGTYTMRLVVDDGTDSDQDFVVVTAN